MLRTAAMIPAYSAGRSSAWASALAVILEGRGPVSANTVAPLATPATLTGTRENSFAVARTWAASQVGQNGELSSTEELQRGQACSTAVHYRILAGATT